MTEISGVERLFKSTPRNAPDRPQLARRLAETYVELGAAAFRDKTRMEMKRDSLKRKNPKGAGQAQTQAKRADAVLKAARNKSVQYYTLLKTQYPNYAALDEVLYYLAYEYEQASDFKRARKVYYELIQKRPNSKYIPNAYLAFGELFFNEAMGDPSKWELAAQAYAEVIKYKPPKNKVYGYAWYKLGYVYWNKGDFEKALNAFKKTIEYGVAYAQTPNAKKLAESARRDIIPVYALKGDPAQAYNFFKGISGDPGGKSSKTYHMMDELGLNYLDTGHYREAITLYKDLMSRDRDGNSCLYQAHITEATMAMQSNNKDAIVKEIGNQFKVHATFMKSGHKKKAKHQCSNKTGAMATETAMAWHLEAVGSGGQRGTGDTKTMALAAQLYKKVVDAFDAKEYSTFKFPRIVKADWPTIYRIKYAMADLLYFQKDWAKCGPAFDAVVEENPKAAEAAEAAYASVLCYQNIYEETHPKALARKGAGHMPGGKKEDEKKSNADRLKPKKMTENQKGMVTAFNRYICYIKPGKNDKAGKEQLVEVKYARARTYFEAQHWEEAAVGFRDIALHDSKRDVGIYAAQLYLESINVLGGQLDRPSCYDDMGKDVPKFIELYCTGENKTKNEEQCTTLNKIQVDILRLKAQKLVEVADKGGSEAIPMYEKAGTAYFEMFRKYCQDPVRNNQPPQAEKCDEIAYNAAKAFQAARLIAKAIAVRRTLLAYDKKLSLKSPLATKAVYEIGGNYQAIAVYELAAKWFEDYAKLKPTPENAHKALSDAVVLRLGLGDEQEAIDDAKLFRRKFGAKKPAQTAQIAFAVGAHYAEKENWKECRDTLQGAMRVINKAAPDVQVLAHATLGRAYSKLKNGDRQAKREYAKVRGLWKNAASAEQKIRAAYPDEDDAQKDRRLAKALNAVGEAYFYDAEEQYAAKVKPLKFPAYKGKGDKAAVLKHISKKVKGWYVKKKAAIVKVEPYYAKILDLKPVPPPRWVIAAGSRAGLMWGNFVDDFRRAPIPEAWKKDAEIRGTYYQALDSASEPFKVNNAKPALKKCLDLSVKYQYFDQYSRSCEVWLAKNYKAEYHVVDELRGAPTLVNSGLDEKSPPLLVGGAFWHPKAAPPPEKKKSEESGDDKAGKKAGKKKKKK